MTDENVKKIISLKDYLESQIPSVTSFCAKVVLAILIFFIGRKLIRWFIGRTRKYLVRTTLDAGIISFVCSAGKIVLYLLLIFNIAIGLGVQASSVAALLGTLGITVGLGIQGGLENLAGGVLLLVFKPFVVGDYIIQDKANGVEGTVSKIEMCYTTLVSIDNKNIVIPNGSLANSTIINVTAKDKRKLEIKIGISYDSDIKKAKEVLYKILEEDSKTQHVETESQVFVYELGDSAVILGLRVWVATEEYWTTKWRLNERIKEEFDKNGIVIPYNQMDVYVHEKS